MWLIWFMGYVTGVFASSDKLNYVQILIFTFLSFGLALWFRWFEKKSEEKPSG